MKDIDAANTDRIYVLDENGDLKGYYFDVDSADGDIVNFPLWDTELDTLDEDGDSLTDDYIHVLYIATSSGKIIKVIDTGSSFLTPASGTPWETSFSSTDVSEITSPLISDGTNIYFGGMDESSNPKIFGLEIDTKTLIMEVSAASVVRAAPSWVKDGQTYLYTGSDESAGQAHIYRVDVPDALAVKDNTSALHDVVAATTVMNERLHVGDLGGRMHGIDALSTDFVNLSGFPYRDTINHTVAELDAGTKGIYAAVYMSFYTNKIYYGDADGHFYVLNPDGTPQSGYPIQPAGTAKIGSAAIFKNGVIYFGNDDGKFIIVDESTASTIKTYDFGSGVKIGDVAYFYDNALFMIGTSTGKVFYIPREDDPTP
jgi:outer membrane protein assembly factor BamB